jgi:carbon-monoxide dehydrogenase medium subunit
MLLGSTHSIPKFALHRPVGIREAVEMLEHYGPDAVPMAGGLDLVNRLKAGLKIGHLVYLRGIEPLREVMATDARLKIGAGVTHGRFQAEPLVRKLLPGVSAAWADLGSVRIRHKGTLVGNLISGERTYDVAPILASLGAALTFVAGDGERTVPVEERLEGYSVGLDRSPLCTAIEVPVRPRTVTSYCRLFKPVATVAVTVTDEGDGLMGARVAVECAFPSLLVGSARFFCHDEDQVGGVVEDATETYVATLPQPLGDGVASTEYRRRLIRVVVRRELERAVLSMLGSKGV